MSKHEQGDSHISSVLGALLRAGHSFNASIGSWLLETIGQYLPPRTEGVTLPLHSFTREFLRSRLEVGADACQNLSEKQKNLHQNYFGVLETLAAFGPAVNIEDYAITVKVHQDLTELYYTLLKNYEIEDQRGMDAR